MCKTLNEETVMITVKFITFMQRYSGKKYVEMDLPRDFGHALELILKRFNIPWKNQLEKSAFILINSTPYQIFQKNRQLLNPDDTITFIPIISGG